MSAAVAAPAATPKQTDPTTGYTVTQQPVALTATAPILASGTALTYKDPSGVWQIDAPTATAGFLFGALLYQIDTSGAVEIYDGSANWIPEASFNPADPSLKAAAFAFSQSSGTWTGTFVLSAIPNAATSLTATNTSGPLSGKPKYGFVAIFATPKPTPTITPTTAVRSPLGTAFGISTNGNTSQVQPGLVQGTTPTQNTSNADGFAVFVNDKFGNRVSDLIVSSEVSLPQCVMLQFYSGGVVRASVALEPNGNVHLTSANQITLDAPVVVINGTLEAQNIEYVPYGGSVSEFL
jgi:hypothetical protein